MNTFFKSLVAIFATALPVALTAETYGVSLPAVVNTSHMFGAFVIALTILTLWSDYTPARTLTLSPDDATANVPASRTHLPLAA